MNKIKINQHSYWLDDKGPRIESFNEPPKTLLKFFPLNRFSVDCILGSYFYSAFPWETNDTYELTSLPNQDFFISQQDQSRILLTHGIVSMAHPSNIFNPLMWAHYTNHEGFVIEFDYESILSKYHGPYPINYLDSYPNRLIINQLKKEDLLLRMACWTNFKHDIWRYENEWRFISYTTKGIYKQPSYLEINQKKNLKRAMYFENTGIKQILLGQKFLYQEPNLEFSSKEMKIIFTKKLKSRLLNYIMISGIPCSVLAFRDPLSFSYGQMPVSITKFGEAFIINKF